MEELAEFEGALSSGIDADRVLELFLSQIRKDFAMCNITLELEKDDCKLKSVLTEKIGLVIRKNQALLPELFYRIDLPEDKLNKEIRERMNEQPESVMAEMIIKRILQKVILKIRFSQ